MNYLDPSQWTATTDLYNNQLVVDGSDYWVEDAGKTWSLTAPTTGTLRFEVRSGDVWAQGDGTITPLKNRSEIAGTTTYSLGTDLHVKYGWTVEAGATNTASWLSTAQFRQVANDPYSAPFGIMMNGEKMRIYVAEGGTSGSNFTNVYLDSQNIVRGHQYQMQIDVRFDPVHGHLDVIRDGVTLVNYDGPVGWSDLGGVYWKEGVYRADSPETMAMDYSNLSVTTGAQTTPTAPATPTAPSAPTGLQDAAIVGGYVNAVHDVASQALTGSAAAGATITVYDGTAKLGVATASSTGQWSYTLGHLADGGHSLTATAADSAGNVSAASAALNFTVDTLAPAAPSGLADSAIVNGVVDAAHDTASQALTGTAAAGATVTVYDGAAKLGAATANSSGQWSYTLGQLADGSHSLTSTATDAAGNVSPTSGALQFAVNTQAAAATTGASINGTAGNETLWGTASGHDAINGLGGNDIIFGVGPAESLNGGSGNDMLFGRGDGVVMTGGTGNDFFVFDTAIHNATVTDFDPLQDIILLQHDVFKGMATGKLSASDLYIGTTAQNSSQHIIYNPTTGNLMYDSDGSGSAQAQTIAHLQTGLTLHSWDFTVY